MAKNYSLQMQTKGFTSFSSLWQTTSPPPLSWDILLYRLQLAQLGGLPSIMMEPNFMHPTGTRVRLLNIILRSRFLCRVLCRVGIPAMCCTPQDMRRKTPAPIFRSMVSEKVVLRVRELSATLMAGASTVIMAL